MDCALLRLTRHRGCRWLVVGCLLLGALTLAQPGDPRARAMGWPERSPGRGAGAVGIEDAPAEDELVRAQGATAGSGYALYRHKPGRLPRSYNPYLRDPQGLAAARGRGYRGPAAPPLERQLADGSLTDPFAGNRVLVPRQQVVTLFEGDNNGIVELWQNLFEATMAPEFALGVQTGTEGRQSGQWSPARGAVAADVNADGRDELVNVYDTQPLAGAPCLGLQVQATDSFYWTGSWTSGPCERDVSYVHGARTVQTTLLTAGTYYTGTAGLQGQQVVMAWNASRSGTDPSGHDENICLRVWDNAVGSTQLTPRGLD